MTFPCSGVILAGGLNSRFSGRNKAMIEIDGKRILDRIYEVFSEIFEEIILVTNDPLQYRSWDMTMTSDIFSIRSSLTGIHAGLFCISNPYTFVTACDAPFLKKEMIQSLIQQITPKADVIIPETSTGLEPLCAVYSKQCLRPIERNLIEQKFRIRDIFRQLRVKKVSETFLRETDPELISFINVNTPEELDKASDILHRIRPEFSHAAPSEAGA